MSGNVKLNPGPMKKCTKCEKMMPTRSNNCKCGYFLYYVAAKVLHFIVNIHVHVCSFSLILCLINGLLSICFFLPVTASKD